MSARIPTIVGVVVLLLFVFYSPVQADVRINEFSSQTNPEWIELYNPDEETRALSGITLYFAGDTDTTQKVSFCSGTSMSGKTYVRIVRPEGSYWLSNSGDTITLKREDDVIDSITFGSQLLKAPVGTQSATRNTEGVWVITDIPSPSGDVINFVCPTIAPTNTPSSTPTVTKIPTGTPEFKQGSSTKFPTPSCTVKPTSFVRVISESREGEDIALNGSVLGDDVSLKEATPPTSMLVEKRPYIIALVSTAIGLALIAAVSVIKIRYTK